MFSTECGPSGSIHVVRTALRSTAHGDLEVSTPEPVIPVAERAGVGQASLYRRYTSKHALVSRVCERGMTQTREAPLAALRVPGDPWDALAGFLRWYLESATPRLAVLVIDRG
jgi:Bacterial regulatory proteins, tetR family